MQKKRIKLNPAFIKKFWWLAIPIVGVLGGGAYLLFFKKTTIAGGGKVPGTPQQGLPTLQPGGQQGLAPVVTPGPPEREIYTGGAVSVLDVPGFASYSNIKDRILGYNIRDTFKSNKGAVYQLQKNLDGQGKYIGPFNGEYTQQTKTALEKLDIENPTYGETDWRQTLPSLGITIREAIPFTPDYIFSKTISVNAFIERYISDVGYPYPATPWSPPPIASVYPDKVTAEMITGLQMKLEAAGFSSGLYLGRWNNDVIAALNLYYESVKNEILDLKFNSGAPMYISPSVDPDDYPGTTGSVDNVRRAMWHWAIYKLLLDTTNRLARTPYNEGDRAGMPPRVGR